MRGKPAPKRPITPDPRYNDVMLAKFINYVMRDGKKTTARKVVYGAMDIIKDKSKGDPLAIFEDAMKNVQPNVEVRSKRVGGANYQVPFQVRGERRVALGFRWVIAAAQAKKGRPMAEKLATELMAAAAGEGDAVRKRTDVHRMAEANRAFAHFAR